MRTTRSREEIENMCGCVQRFDPVQRRKVCLEKKRPDHVSDIANHTFGMTILSGSVGARVSRNNAVLGEK